MDLELAPWTAPPDYRERLSLERPRPLPSIAPSGQVAHDLRWFDSFPQHPERTITARRMFAAFMSAEHGYPQLQVDLIDGLTQGDAHARNVFEHRERVVANKPLVFGTGDDSEEAADAAAVLSLAMSRLPTKQAWEHLLRTNRYGYAGAEIDWGLIDYKGRPWVVPVALTLVPARRFRIGTAGMLPTKGEVEVRVDELRLYRTVTTPQGEPLEPGKWIVLLRQPTQVARGGLGVTAAPLMMIKRVTVRDWVVLSERFGLPFPIVKYGDGGDQESLNTALEILRRIGTDGGAAVHKDLELEIKDGVRVKGPMQDRLAGYCNAELSKLVNGSTLRNDNTEGGGSYGLGDVHDSVAWDEVRDDGEMLSEAINLQIALPFARFNRLKSPPPVGTIVVEPDLGPAEFMSLAVKFRNELGGKVSLSQLRQRTGVRAPINAEDEAPGMQVMSFPTGAGGNP